MTVDIHRPAVHLDVIARQADHSFDIVVLWGIGIAEHDYVSALRSAEEVADFIEHHVLAGVQGRLHALPQDDARLDGGMDAKIHHGRKEDGGDDVDDRTALTLGHNSFSPWSWQVTQSATH